MFPSNTVAVLREEAPQEDFLERFGNARPNFAGEQIDQAFQEGIRAVSLSAHREVLEREMERLLGIVSDEEE
jgi:hypothetical protein